MLVEVITAVVHGPAELQRLVEQVRLRKRQRVVLLVLSHRNRKRKRFAFAKQIVGGVIHANKSTVQSAHTAGEADAVLTLFSDLQQDVHCRILGVLLDFRILLRFERFEILQLV